MTHQHLIRQIRQSPDGSQADPWEDPRWEERWTIRPQESSHMDADYDYLGFCTIGAWGTQLELAWIAGQMASPVRVMRIYQRRPNTAAGGEYQVFFVANFDWQRPSGLARLEMRVACGEQDLDQDSESHAASAWARTLQERVVESCQQLGIEVAEGQFGKHRP